MMERAAVPPRTIKKLSDLFWAATFILDFFLARNSATENHPPQLPDLSVESAAQLDGAPSGPIRLRK